MKIFNYTALAAALTIVMTGTVFATGDTDNDTGHLNFDFEVGANFGGELKTVFNGDEGENNLYKTGGSSADLLANLNPCEGCDGSDLVANAHANEHLNLDGYSYGATPDEVVNLQHLGVGQVGLAVRNADEMLGLAAKVGFNGTGGGMFNGDAGDVLVTQVGGGGLEADMTHVGACTTPGCGNTEFEVSAYAWNQQNVTGWANSITPGVVATLTNAGSNSLTMQALLQKMQVQPPVEP